MERTALPKHLTSGAVADGFTVSFEIERKFVLKQPPQDIGKYPHAEIFQSYLKDHESGKWLRVRETEGKHILNIKGPGLLKKREAEKEISAEDYKMLLAHTDRSMHKVRYRIPYKGYTIELDVYNGKLTGLVTIEIEFPSVKEARAFSPPEWFGTEVTRNKRYKSRKLAKHGIPKDDTSAESLLRK